MSFRKLKGVDNIGEFGPSENIAENVIRFFDWGFVNAGGFNNVQIPSSSLWGGRKDSLTLNRDVTLDGQAWEAGRKNWVWETGVDGDEQPVEISGVFVNNTFYPKDTTGAYSHYYNYENGQVVFDTAIATNSTVRLEYAYKTITVIDAYTIPFFQRLQQTGFTFIRDMVGSGDFLLAGENKLQLPVVAVEIAPMQDQIGYSLGTGARKATHTILCHVITNNPNMNRRIGDIIADQSDKTIFMYDLNTLVESGVYPLDSRGMVVDDVMSYPELVTSFPWNRLRFMDASNNQKIQQINQGTYLSTTRLTTQVILSKL